MTLFVRLPRALAAFAALIAIALPAAAQERATLNFRDAEIQAFIDDVSIVTGYTFIVDPDVRGRVTITSQTDLGPDEVFSVFLATLRVQGYAAVRTAPGVYRIVPEGEGAGSGAPRRAAESPDDIFMTQVIPLRAANADEAVRAVAPMTSQTGSVNPIPSGNAIVVIDYASNIQAIEAALRDLDRDDSVVETVELRNVPAEEMAGIVERLNQPGQGGDSRRRAPVSVAPVPSSNALILRGESRLVSEMAALARRVDGVSRATQTYRVISLAHADGAQLVPILDQLSGVIAPGGGAEGGGEGGEAGSSGAAPAGRRDTSIAFHEPTNSIIINADADVLRELEQVVRALDVRRPQVLVEAIIVEISDTAARDLGLQFLLGGEDGAVPFAATRFGAADPDLLAITGAIAAEANGEEGEAVDDLRDLAVSSLLGTSGGLFGVGGRENGMTFGVILNALESDTDSNILSAPSLMMLDNEEGSILVGQDIPITTGEALGANNENPFRTIQREEIGVKLTVTPQINDGDTIRLLLAQEVSSLAGPISAGFQELLINTREIDTTVLADNGEIIVLGGLIERDDEYADDRVPGLGSIPGVGRLFRSESRSQTRTNLMVFLRPTIVRGREEAAEVSSRSYEMMRSEQYRATGGQSSSLEDVVRMMQGEARGPVVDLTGEGE